MIAVLAALAGAALGYALALSAAMGLLGLFGVSQAEGKRAMTAGLLIAPFGALLGAGVGIWLSLRWVAPPGAGAVLLTLGVLAAGVAAVLLWLRGHRPLGQNRAAPRLQVEIRVRGEPARLSAQLVTDRNTMPVSLAPDQVRREGPFWIVPGEVDLYFRTSRRHLMVESAGAEHRFALPLRAAPAPSPVWSDWTAPAAEAAPQQGIALRWRVAEA